jgi:tetratricopeptide (TPR) repeat protein
MGHVARTRERGVRAAIAEGEDFLKKGRPAMALRAVSDVPESESFGSEVLAVRGLALAALDRPHEARPVLERALQRNPKQAMVAKVLAAVYFSQNEMGRGFALLTKAAQLDTADFRPWYAAGDVYRRLDLPDKAAPVFRESLRRRPDHHESRVGLIWAMLATGAREEVTPLLNRALRDRPDDPETLALAARHARSLANTKEALSFADRCLVIDPDQLDALLIRAQLNHTSGHSEVGLADAEHAVALAPDNPAALYILAQIESALGRYERAAATSARHRELHRLQDRIQQLRTQAEANRDDPEPRWRLGQLAAEAGLTSLAVQSFRAALALDPRCQPALRGLASIESARAGTHN